jgi:hypothetical protein
MDQDRQLYTMQQEKFKKMLCKYGKSQILIARLHFSMVLLWRQLHRDFLRFANWTRPSGRRGTCIFYQVAQGQHPLSGYYALFRLMTAESLSCPKSILYSSIGSIGGLTIFQGQQYSSCSKAGGCRAAQLLGGSRKNLLIVSWATPTLGGKANFPGNWYMQPAAYFAPIRQICSRASCRVSGRSTFHQFFGVYSSTAKKGCRQGAMIWESGGIPS